jgi:hypothetical protein
VIGSLIGSFGFRTTFSISFATLVSPPIGPAQKVPLPMLIPVDRRFFEIDASVRMTSAAAAGTFELTIVGFDRKMYDQMKKGSTLVTITLGYSDGGTSDVIEGLLLDCSLAPKGCFYEATLKGDDYAFATLRDHKKIGYTADPNQTVGQIAKAVCGKIGLDIQADDGPPLANYSVNDQAPLDILLNLAHRGTFVLQTKDGKVYLGAPASIGSTDPVPFDDDASATDGAARGKGADGPHLSVTNYHAAGRPKLRPRDVVTIGTDQYRVDTVTHDFKRDGSYVVSGRAIAVSASRADAAAAAKSTASSTADVVRGALNSRDEKRPAVTAGVVKTYNDGHTSDVSTGVAKTPDMITPTTSAPLRSDPVTFAGKPIASPFAFDHCGLMVPVYAGMRALMVHGWNDPNDAVVDGFLWDDTMTKPGNQSGDWWLCLPTNLDQNGKPTGSGVDDLIDATGKRVITATGLRIAIGSGLLKNVGTRPDLGKDDTLTIESDQGPKIEISGNTVSVTDGSITLKIANGTVSIG